MKRFGICLLLTVLLGCAAAKADVTGYVLCEALTVRDAPDATAQSLGTLPYGTTFAISEEQGNWWRIYGQMEGWVDSTYALKQPEFIVVNKEAPVYPTASLSGKRVGLVTAGTSLAVIERQRDYLVISLRGGSGYIAMSDSGVPIQDDLEPNYGYQYYATVNNPGSWVNLRESESLDADVLVEIPHGSSVGVISQNKSWSYVVYDGKLGYIMNQYLDSGEDVAAAPATNSREYTADVHFDEMGYTVRAFMLEIVDDYYDAWVNVTIDSGTHLRRFPTDFKVYINGRHVTTLPVSSGDTWDDDMQCLFLGQFTFAEDIHEVKVIPHVGEDWDEDWEQDTVYLAQ